MRLDANASSRAVYICQHVFDVERPIRLVVHDAGGDLMMLCGETDHDWESHRPRVVGLGHLLGRDPGIGGLDIAPGFEARLCGDQWAVAPTPGEEEAQ